MVSLKLPDNAATRAWRDWKTLLRTARPVRNIAVLDRRHIYILPTRQGLLFALVLACMLVGSINYALSLGFVLTFLLAGLGVIAMLHTWRNLVRLTIIAGKAPPVFAGEDARFGLTVADTDGRSRFAIGLRHGEAETVFADAPAGNSNDVVLPLKSSRRGWLTPGKLTVSTEFPLGLFLAWSYVEPASRCLVYPRPAPPGLPLPASGSDGKSGRTAATGGDDDFSGLRAYQHGDSLRRIDWKASAREQGLFTKQFQGTSSAALWLDWQSAGGGTETKISQLARWVLDAHAAGQSYGLRLPGAEIGPATGESQLQKCLEALALFGEPR